MKQLVYVGPKQLEWQEKALPKLNSGQAALVKPMAVARCDLDRFIALGQYRTPGPFALGHEIAGIVEDVGDGVKHYQPGDRVIVPFQINCGECTNCLRGWTNACAAVPPLAAYGLGTDPDNDFGGGFSDSVLVPFADSMLVKIPDSLSMETACGLSDNVADGYRTVAPLLSQFPQAPVLVVGGLAASVGLYAVQSAIACGSEQVVYVDNDETRLRQAKHLGASTQAIDFSQQKQNDQEFLIVVEANCTPEGMAYAIRSTAACGNCTSVSGGLSPETSLPLNSAYLKGINYQVSRVHSRATLPEVVNKVCCQSIDPLAFANPTLEFSQAGEALFEPASKIIFSRTV